MNAAIERVPLRQLLLRDAELHEHRGAFELAALGARRLLDERRHHVDDLLVVEAIEQHRDERAQAGDVGRIDRR